MKASIFLDFWNFSLGLKDFDPAFQADWYRIPRVFVEKAGDLLGSVLTLEDFHIFGSCSNQVADKALRHWTETFLPKIPGASVHFYERTLRKSLPKCPSCLHEIGVCPVCGNTMRGTEEKGVDTMLATTMLHDGFFRKYDVAVLVSADRDFIPAVDFLHAHAVKVIHAQFGAKGMQLRKSCWAGFDIREISKDFKR